MTTQTTVAIALQTALNPARFQLDIAAGKVDGTAKTAVQAAITMVNQAEELALEQYNIEIDEYNTLCDQFEACDKDLSKTKLELSVLHVPPQRLLTLVKSQGEKEAIKGFGDAAVRQVYSKLKGLVADWEKSQTEWTPVRKAA